MSYQNHHRGTRGPHNNVPAQRPNAGAYNNMPPRPNAGAYNNMSPRPNAGAYNNMSPRPNAGAYNNMTPRPNAGAYNNMSAQRPNASAYSGRRNSLGQRRLPEKFDLRVNIPKRKESPRPATHGAWESHGLQFDNTNDRRGYASYEPNNREMNNYTPDPRGRRLSQVHERRNSTTSNYMDRRLSKADVPNESTNYARSGYKERRLSQVPANVPNERLTHATVTSAYMGRRLSKADIPDGNNYTPSNYIDRRLSHSNGGNNYATSAYRDTRLSKADVPNDRKNYTTPDPSNRKLAKTDVPDSRRDDIQERRSALLHNAKMLQECQEQLRSKRKGGRKEQKIDNRQQRWSKENVHQRALSIGAEQLLGNFTPQWPTPGSPRPPPPRPDGRWRVPPSPRGNRMTPPSPRGNRMTPPSPRGNWRTPPSPRGAWRAPPSPAQSNTGSASTFALGTPTRSEAGSAIAGGPFAAEVDMVPCPVRETFDWTDVRGAGRQPMRPPVEDNWNTRAESSAEPFPAQTAARSKHARTASQRIVATYRPPRDDRRRMSYNSSSPHTPSTQRSKASKRHSSSSTERRASITRRKDKQEVELEAPPLLVRGTNSVRQVEKSLNHVPANAAIVGRNRMVIVYSNRKRAYFTCVRGQDGRWRVGKRCSFQPQTKKQLKSIQLMLVQD